MTHTPTITHFPDTPLWTAIVTPMLPDGNVDFASLDTLIQQQVDAGNGILLLGSTGEALAFTTAEKRAIFDHVIANKPDTPLMVGIGGFQLPEELEWITYCQKAGVDAFLLGSPIYAKPGPEGQYQWFKALLDHSTKPCMIYNIPGRSAVVLSLDALARLKDHDNFWAIKEAGGTVQRLIDDRDTLPGIDLFSGDDALLPGMAAEGARGLISVASNVWPKATHKYVRDALANPTRDDLTTLGEAMNSLFLVSNPIPAKCLLAKRGDIQYDTLRAPLTAEELTDIAPILAADKTINDWYTQ